jgi:hypothetical protein
MVYACEDRIEPLLARVRTGTRKEAAQPGKLPPKIQKEVDWPRETITLWQETPADSLGKKASRLPPQSCATLTRPGQKGLELVSALQ